MEWDEAKKKGEPQGPQPKKKDFVIPPIPKPALAKDLLPAEGLWGLGGDDGEGESSDSDNDSGND